MEIRSTPSGATIAKPSLSWRKKLADIRQTMRHAVQDDIDDQRYLLDDVDMAWLADLPHILPRGSVLNILI